MRRLAILGSTGSVGEQTLAVAASFPDRFRVCALAARRNVERLAEQVLRFEPDVVSVGDAGGAKRLREMLPGARSKIVHGDEGLAAVASHASDLVVAAMVGAAGLPPTLTAIRAGRSIALANKEVLVMAGALVLREVRAHGVALLPIDSEHSAIFQVLAGQRREDLARIVLTASGGPFRTWPAERMAAASVQEALRHPNWSMGPKITIDSATLMNKGLELIEARWLFDAAPDQLDVVVHPQSIVHSLIELRDGSVLAQLGLPDMRIPIAVALAHPERLALDAPRLELAKIERLDFEAPDRARFPALDLAAAALRGDEAAPAALNAANEVAVAAFLDGQIAFPAIASVCAEVLERHLGRPARAPLTDLASVLETDAWARAEAGQCVRRYASARNGASR